MEQIDLGGVWKLRQDKVGKSIAAAVPGCVHTDLLAAGLIPDPFFRDNETHLQWIGKAEWNYSREIEATADLLAHDRVLLVCEGLDTLATVVLNGKTILEANNMYRTWEIDVKGLLRAGKNALEIRFATTVGSSPEAQVPKNDPRHGHRFKEFVRAHFRKEPCNYGWDWGPSLVTCGIWRPIRLVAFNTARLSDFHITQKHSKNGAVTLGVALGAERLSGEGLRARVVLSFKGKVIVEKTMPVNADTARCPMLVPNPQLWWPRGMGEQPLYDVRVELLTADGTMLDTQSRRIGLRTLNLVTRKDKWGESFHFTANGLPFFAKGANWIPADPFAARVRPKDLYRLVGDSAAANMNMLRVWGGGIYEEDAFYDACDEFGVCVWQDFMFACATYPTYDKKYMTSIEAEARDNIRRLRHHPSMALWCGNNEIELGFFVAEKWDGYHMSWADYGLLFDELLPNLVKELDPGRDYWPGSPHSSQGERIDSGNPACGDAHLWDVWHGGRPFEWYRTAFHRFVSEFGFQSFPEPKTVYAYTNPEDRNIVTRVMELHQKCGTGNSNILGMMLSWFRVPRDFDSLLYLSQIQHGMAMQYAVEHWRRNMPRCMGALYWQLNDCWPVASWASIDSYGRWKALHHMARRFYAPLLVSGVEKLEDRSIELHVTSDMGETTKGVVAWRFTNAVGKTLASGSQDVKIAPRTSAMVGTLKLAKHVEADKMHDAIVWLSLQVEGKTVSQNLVLFARPKHIDLPVPDITTTIRPLKDGRFMVRLQSATPALWTWLELRKADAQFSDNYFHIAPGTTAEIEVTPERPMSVEAFTRQLLVRTVVDTF